MDMCNKCVQQRQLLILSQLKKNISSINAPVFIISAHILIKFLAKIKIVRMIWKRPESQPVAS